MSSEVASATLRGAPPEVQARIIEQERAAWARFVVASFFFFFWGGEVSVGGGPPKKALKKTLGVGGVGVIIMSRIFRSPVFAF